MGGRKSELPDSSIAVSEESVFKAKHPQQHSDNWPIIDLKDVEIFVPGTSPNEPANLLEAGSTNPLVVRGTVEDLDSNQLKRCLHKGDLTSGRRIEITEVRQFSYGAYDDGSIELWAAGKAGWYTILPNVLNQSTYDCAIEAVRLHYFITDATAGVPLKKQKLDQILIDYAKHDQIPGGPEQARRRLRQHKRFILTCMLRDKAGAEPTENVVYDYLAKSCGREIEEIKRALAKPFVPADTADQKPTAQDKLTADTADRKPTGQENRKRKRESETPPATPRSKRSRQTSKPATHVVKTEQGATPPAHLHNQSDERVSRARSQEAVRRMTNAARWLAEESDDTDEGQAGPASQSRESGKGKSSLRPKPTKYVDKSSTDTHPRRNTIALPPATSATSAYREPASVASSVDECAQRAAKRSRQEDYGGTSFGCPRHVSNANLDEGIDMSLDDMDDSPAGSFPPIPEAFAIQVGQIRATDNGDTWRCPLDGCLHAVYGASEVKSQALIREHYRMHVLDEDTDSKMQLVNRMRAPGACVDRLLSRIRAQAGRRNGNFPPRIVQRL